MHFLTNGLPAEITAGEKKHPVCCDFRRWILITKLFGEECLPADRKLYLAARIAGIPDTVERNGDLAEGIISFASCGHRGRGEAGEPVFDFDADGDAIFAGFLQTYSIDLTESSMHWWKFNALLKQLPPDTEFMRRVELRTLDVSRIEDDGMRKKLRRAKARVRLTRNNSNQQKEE